MIIVRVVLVAGAAVPEWVVLAKSDGPGPGKEDAGCDWNCGGCEWFRCGACAGAGACVYAAELDGKW
jgi:hypothetical protein